MKRIKKIIQTTLVVLLLTSCIEHYKISTKINRDGSITRTITVVGDSNCVNDGSIFFPADSVKWSFSQKSYKDKKHNEEDEDQFEYTATRTFANIDELNAYLKSINEKIELQQSKVSYEENFRWFYTYIRYKDTYLAHMPVVYSPIDSFLTDVECTYIYDDEFTYLPEKDSLIHIKDLKEMPLLSHEDSIRMDDLENELMLKLSDWIGHNVFEAYLEVIYKSEILTQKQVQTIKHNKEQIYKKTNLSKIFTDNILNDEGDKLENIAIHLGIDPDSLKTEYLEEFDKYVEVVLGDLFFSDYEIKNSVILPGTLLNTNADSIAGNACFWDYNLIRNFAKEQSFIAESRTANNWAFVVTTLLVLIALIYLVISFRK